MSGAASLRSRRTPSSGEGGAGAMASSAEGRRGDRQQAARHGPQLPDRGGDARPGERARDHSEIEGREEQSGGRGAEARASAARTACTDGVDDAPRRRSSRPSSSPTRSTGRSAAPSSTTCSRRRENLVILARRIGLAGPDTPASRGRARTARRPCAAPSTRCCGPAWPARNPLPARSPRSRTPHARRSPPRGWHRWTTSLPGSGTSATRHARAPPRARRRRAARRRGRARPAAPVRGLLLALPRPLPRRGPPLVLDGRLRHGGQEAPLRRAPPRTAATRGPGLSRQRWAACAVSRRPTRSTAAPSWCAIIRARRISKRLHGRSSRL